LSAFVEQPKLTIKQSEGERARKLGERASKPPASQLCGLELLEWDPRAS